MASLCVAADYGADGNRKPCSSVSAPGLLVCDDHGCHAAARRPRLPVRLVGAAQGIPLRVAEEEALHSKFMRIIDMRAHNHVKFSKDVVRACCTHAGCLNVTQLHPYCPYHLLVTCGLLVDLQRVRPDSGALDLGVYVFSLALPAGAPVVSDGEYLCCLRRRPGDGCEGAPKGQTFAEKLTRDDMDDRYGDFTAPWGVTVPESGISFDGAYVQTPALLANTNHTCNAVFEHRVDPEVNVLVVASTVITNGQALLVSYGDDYTLSNMPRIIDKPSLKERLAGATPGSLYNFGGAATASLTDAPPPSTAPEGAVGGLSCVRHCQHLGAADVCQLLRPVWDAPLSAPLLRSTPGWVKTALELMRRQHELGGLAWARALLARSHARIDFARHYDEARAALSDADPTSQRAIAFLVAGMATCLTRSVSLGCQPPGDVRAAARRALALLWPKDDVHLTASPAAAAAALLALQQKAYAAPAPRRRSPMATYSASAATMPPPAAQDGGDCGALWVMHQGVHFHLPAVVLGPAPLLPPFAVNDAQPLYALKIFAPVPGRREPMRALLEYLNAVACEVEHNCENPARLLCRLSATLENVQRLALNLRQVLLTEFCLPPGGGGGRML